MNPKPLWNKTVDNPRPLRNSKCVTEHVSQQNQSLQVQEKTNTDQHEPTSGSSLLQNSLFDFEAMQIKDEPRKLSLNPEAPEWYPTNPSVTYNAEPPSSIQDRLKRPKSHPEPQSLHYKGDDEFEISSENLVYNDGATESDKKRLKQIVITLSKDPGEFDNLLDLFLESLMPYLEDILALRDIVKIIVEQAINDPNFRYTGAKLCWYAEQNCPGFRAELHIQCTKLLDSNNSLQNVVFFIAELYTQLPHLNMYGSLLIEAFKKLFANGGNENIKCICQALKLTGYSLEQSNKANLDEIMQQLEASALSLNGSILSLVNSIGNLRQSNWGHSDDSFESEDNEGMFYEGSATSPIVYEGSVTSPIVYQTDGNNLTSEENDFIAAHFHYGNEEYLSDASDPDELCDPEPEMDEEIQAAFKEFLKYSSRK